jgi:hypothetical protein
LFVATPLHVFTGAEVGAGGGGSADVGGGPGGGGSGAVGAGPGRGGTPNSGLSASVTPFLRKLLVYLLSNDSSKTENHNDVLTKLHLFPGFLPSSLDLIQDNLSNS